MKFLDFENGLSLKYAQLYYNIADLASILVLLDLLNLIDQTDILKIVDFIYVLYKHIRLYHWIESINSDHQRV